MRTTLVEYLYEPVYAPVGEDQSVHAFLRSLIIPRTNVRIEAGTAEVVQVAA
jgi:hypothetical protein